MVVASFTSSVLHTHVCTLYDFGSQRQCFRSEFCLTGAFDDPPRLRDSRKICHQFIVGMVAVCPLHVRHSSVMRVVHEMHISGTKER
jgi:hypothetical protein